jgi:N-acylneuraminate cytidylyltransferase
MKSVAILPLRKGSKGIPGKNKKRLLGRSLYQWILGEAIQSNLTEIYLFTDDDEIISTVEKEYSWTDKVKTWKRSEESGSDTASTEFGMAELAKGINYDFDIYCLLQATSPLTTFADINAVIDKVSSGGSDSALTVVNSKRFIWSAEGKSVNYDFLARPRRQDFEGIHFENGAVYGINKHTYLKSNNRLGGEIALVEMSEDSFFEIDEPSDFLIVEQILKTRLQKSKGSGKKIKALILDVDGVFTPGVVNVSANGELSKTFSLRDGMGLAVAREEGIMVIVMTSENSPIVDRRMEKLNISHYYKGVKDKYALVTKISEEFQFERSEIAYIGDDINDLPNLISAGWGMSPSDAIDEVKQEVDLLLHAKGGDKAIREGIDFILKFNKRIS